MKKNAKKKKKKVKVNKEWCKSCGICVAFCPKKVLEMGEDDKALWAHPKNCINCGLCELRCPDIAIELK